ncbi:hypothetical protein GO497_06205 [Acidovorax citrulli]|nr:hypothetical protein [Paracidovorax citrulli]
MTPTRDADDGSGEAPHHRAHAGAAALQELHGGDGVLGVGRLGEHRASGQSSHRDGGAELGGTGFERGHGTAQGGRRDHE